MTSDTRPGPHRHKCVECGEWLIDPAFLERLHEGELALTRHEKDAHIARLTSEARDVVYALRSQPEISREDIATALENALASQPDIAARPDPECDHPHATCDTCRMALTGMAPIKSREDILAALAVYDIAQLSGVEPRTNSTTSEAEATQRNEP